jgi:hypothetical protein
MQPWHTRSRSARGRLAFASRSVRTRMMSSPHSPAGRTAGNHRIDYRRCLRILPVESHGQLPIWTECQRPSRPLNRSLHRGAGHPDYLLAPGTTRYKDRSNGHPSLRVDIIWRSSIAGCPVAHPVTSAGNSCGLGSPALDVNQRIIANAYSDQDSAGNARRG